MGSYPEPEILQPDGSYVKPSVYANSGYAPPPPQLPRKPRPSWAAAPVTYVLLGINCAVFVAMVLKGVSPVSPNSLQLMHWGANHAGAVLLGGQWWRVVTAMFVHAGIIHLATNLWCLWNLGLLAEPLMGSFGLMAVYILTGAAGNLLSICSSWWSYHDSGIFPPGVGASGAVFGIAGALIILLKSKQLPVPPEELKKLRKSVIYFAALNLFIGFSVNFGSGHFGTGIFVDNSAHIGGCLCGLLFAAPMVPRIGSPRPLFQLRLRIAVGMIVGLLVLFGFFLVNLSSQG